MFRSHIVRVTALAGLMAATASLSQAQQSLTTEQIINSLQNSATPTTMSADDILGNIKNSFRIDDADRSVKLPTQSTTRLVKDLPKMDFEIFFDYNSAAIKPESLPTIMLIGKALSDAKLAGSRFIVAGHTDAAGSPSYNAGLSQRRADAVRDFILRAFPVSPINIVAYGFGEEQLKNTVDPEAAINRRVQIINVGR